MLFYLLFELLLYLMYLYLVPLLLQARAQHGLLVLVVYTVVGSSMLLLAFIGQYALLGCHSGQHACQQPRYTIPLYHRCIDRRYL